MKITAIKQQVKNPERVSIFVDGKYSFSLSLDELLREKINNNDELSVADVKRLKKISADGKLRMRALEWLLNRPHSAREFRDYLYRKKTEPETIEALSAEFQSKGYLDDTKYAHWLIDMRARSNKSNRAIRSELFKQGVSREIIEDVTAADNTEEQRLKELIAKKQNVPRYQKDPEKLKMYLLRQGFSYDQIKQHFKD